MTLAISRDRLWMACFAAWVRAAKPPFQRGAARGGRRRRPLAKRVMGRAMALFASRLPFPPAETPRTPSDPLPRVIWMYWHDGETEAPELVQLCIDSWRRLNPGWEVRVLDRRTAPALSDPCDVPPDASLSHVADLLRADLLAGHGGVWADATALCTRPLDQWLHDRMKSGFFAFSRPGPDRVVSNWFLAARPGAPLAGTWARALRDFWRIRGSVGHYFIMHYLFEWMLLVDQRAQEAWARTPGLSAAPPHLLQKWLKRDAPDPKLERRLRTAMSDPDVPVQKLDWRIEDGGARLRGFLDVQSRHSMDRVEPESPRR